MALADTDRSSRAGLAQEVLGVLLLLACGPGYVHAMARGPHARLADANPRVNDVLAALQSISARPRVVPCHSNDFAVPSGGHFQGIQQANIEGKPFVVVSGSASADSYLALLALEGPAARIVALKPLLTKPFKHAGGFQICGDYLAVGIEDDNTKEASKVWVLALAELLRAGGPRPAIEIERHGPYKRATAGAVALAKIRNRHVLCVGTWDSATIDFYHSNSRRLDDPACQFELGETWEAKKADRSNWSDRDFASYQNLNLVVDAGDHMFLVGFARTGGADVMDIFEIEFHLSPERRFRKLHRRALQGQETGFQHGAGLTVVDAETLVVLACGYREFVIESFEPPRR